MQKKGPCKPRVLKEHETNMCNAMWRCGGMRTETAMRAHTRAHIHRERLLLPAGYRKWGSYP